MSLAQVQALAQKGKRAEANALLKRIIQQQPSADAWYVAAKLTEDSKLASKYLQRALMYDPNHRHAHAMLRELRGRDVHQAEIAGTVAFDLLKEVQNFGLNRSYLRPLMEPIGPWGRTAVVVGLFAFIVFFNLRMIGFMNEPDTAAAAADEFRPVLVQADVPALRQMDTEPLVTHFSSLGFGVQVLPAPAESFALQMVELYINDSGATQAIQIYLYDYAEGTLIDGIAYAAGQTDKSYRIDGSTIVVYPATLRPELIDYMAEAMQYAPFHEPIALPDDEA